jgi:hypothetical protein
MRQDVGASKGRWSRLQMTPTRHLQEAGTGCLGSETENNSWAVTPLVIR